MEDRYFFDFRNIFDPAEMKKTGFQYYGVGRLKNRKKKSIV